MKKVLTFEAGRSEALSLEHLSEFVANAEELGFRLSQSPVITLQPGTTRWRERGVLIKISVSKEVYG
jgi:hypothetical protein